MLGARESEGRPRVWLRGRGSGRFGFCGSCERDGLVREGRALDGVGWENGGVGGTALVSGEGEGRAGCRVG